MMREIIVDTETTGLNPRDGHRLVELACVELVNGFVSGEHYQTYINPERDVPDEAHSVHGLSTDFLKDKPLFHEIADDFLSFIGDDRLVIHNAEFDLGFLNAELAFSHKAVLSSDRVVDTLTLARSMFPGASVSLDALCKRFDIDTSRRKDHGALIDCHLLAEVYQELTGGKQNRFDLTHQDMMPAPVVENGGKPVRPARSHPPLSESERAAHHAMLERIKDALWLR